MKAKIYLDFNSTHPPDHAALAQAREFYLEHFANSSGLSLESQKANERIEKARDTIADLLAVTPGQIIFTSSATEANNLLLREFHRRMQGADFRVLNSPFEHPSIAEPLRYLTNTTVSILPARHDGSLEINKLPEFGDFDLAMTMAVQNESGVILPLAQLVPAYQAAGLPAIVDASQLLPKLANDAPESLTPQFVGFLAANGCYVTATGHKVGAGFGTGLIITPPGDSLTNGTPLLAGGNQEQNFRAGSHNTEAIIALALALSHKLGKNSFVLWAERTQKFEIQLREALGHIKGFEIIGSDTRRAPGTSLLMLPTVPIDFLVMALDKEGITVSTGTSCKSRSRSASAALLAMGYDEKRALSVIRLSYDQNLSDAAMQTTTSAIAKACNSLL